jgi:hypothetical protein
MRKRPRKLSLSRETVRLLQAAEIQNVVQGGSGSACRLDSCDGCSYDVGCPGPTAVTCAGVGGCGPTGSLCSEG